MTVAYEVSEVGNNRKDALKLEILSKDKNEVKQSQIKHFYQAGSFTSCLYLNEEKKFREIK